MARNCGKLLLQLLCLSLICGRILCEDTASPTEEKSDTNPVEQDTTEQSSVRPALKPLKMDEDLACSACEMVVNRMYTDIQNVSAEAKSQSHKVRKEIATDIIRRACFRTRGMSIDGTIGSRYFKYPPLPPLEPLETNSSSKDAGNADADADNADTDAGNADTDAGNADTDADHLVEQLEELVEGPVDQMLFQACYYMMGTEGWKLRSRIAGFYKETTSASLKKRLCHNSLNLCEAAKAPKLKKTEKCLMGMFNAIEKGNWDAALRKVTCATTFKTKPTKAKSDSKVNDSEPKKE